MNLYWPVLSQILYISPRHKGTYMTGQSSTLGLCYTIISCCSLYVGDQPTVKPKTFQTTTSSFSTLSFLATASETPSTSLELWLVNSPPAHSSPSLYLVTQIWWRANWALLAMTLSGCAKRSCVGDGMNLYATGLPEIGFNLDGLVILTVRLVIGEASMYLLVVTGVCRT